MSPRSSNSKQGAAAAPDSIAPFRSHSIEAFNEVGPMEAVKGVILGARDVLEANPDLCGKIHARGTRDAGTLEHAAGSAGREYEEVGRNFILQPNEASTRVPARVFTVIAYNHPYFDGNKRTALFSGTCVAAMLGFEVRDSPSTELAKQVKSLVASEAAVEDVAQWLRDKILALPREGGAVIYRRDPNVNRALHQDPPGLPAVIQRGALLIARKLSPLLKAMED